MKFKIPDTYEYYNKNADVHFGVSNSNKKYLALEKKKKKKH